MAIVSSISCPETHKENHLAEINWFIAFTKINPWLTLQSPEGYSLSRATSFNKGSIILCFDNLEQILKSHAQFPDGTTVE
jgi:hypothetical protein